MTSDPAKQAWQSSVEVAGAPSLDRVRLGTGRFYRVVRRRNLIEYGACALVVVCFTAYIFILPHILQKAGSALVVAATFYVAWQLHRRASAEPPEKAGALPILAFARAQLVRQRDALRSVFWWYILPFLPGLMAITIGNALRPRPGGALGLVGAAVAFMVMIGVLALIWWLNRRAARKLQTHIDEIDVLTGEKA